MVSVTDSTSTQPASAQSVSTRSSSTEIAGELPSEAGVAEGRTRITGADHGPGVWRRMRMWGLAHAVDDLYQGLVPAIVPYFVLDRHYGYVAASGLTLASTLGCSVPQPFIGLAVDRFKLGWLAGVGVALAGLGLALSGLAHAYPLVWCLILCSGIGVSIFHPSAGREARAAAGESAAAMSLFAAGGSVGFFLAPVLATPVLIHWGLGATVLFLPPAALMAFVLLRAHRRQATAKTKAAPRTGPDRWRPFAALTGIEVVRSFVLFGTNTFIELYWIRDLHAGRALAGAALTCFLAGGIGGTLLGGRIADRFGAVRTVQLGGIVVLPMMLAMLWSPGAWVPLLFAALAGVSLNVPFAVLVKLGQDYLPNRPGTAAGVTLGLGVSVGGVIAPVLGLVADARGPRGVLEVLLLAPLVALGLGLTLPEPGEVRATAIR
jgi:FSR family fosmidomycin resistance protein-like MFS transporter